MTPERRLQIAGPEDALSGRHATAIVGIVILFYTSHLFLIPWPRPS